MFKVCTFFFFCSLFVVSTTVYAQKTEPVKMADSSKKKKSNIFSKPDPANYSPRVATLRSAILPGWGQATNKKYWKIPVIYAALGTTTYIFFRNTKQYREARDAYTNAIDNDPTNDYQVPQPYLTIIDQPERIKTFRNQVRQNVDYTVLIFILFWGLNVVDATVDAHLKTFDVSDDLSLQLRPGYSQLANTNGISLVLNIGKNHSK
ncbi:MAG: hypothetical protein IPG38_19170 [Chitinophagaceae bacterium]|nr:hypothetical protein [Chitinophagaceae bacterium]